METTRRFLDVTGEVLARGHAVRFRASGKSMHPTIRDGEAVTVRPVEPSDVRRGDIVLCRTPRGLIAHRVVDIDKREGALRLVLRGDSALTGDGPLAGERVLGRIVSVEREGREVRIRRGPRALVGAALGAARSLLKRALGAGPRRAPGP